MGGSGRTRRVAVDDYLATIYRLEEVFGAARTSDIAEELGVRPATVSKVLRRLADEGYVVWTKFRGFRLSEKGLSFVKPLIRKHRICEAFLAKLGFNPLEAHEYAHHMEHLPQRVVESIHRFLGSPKRCPHGNPIPGEGELPLGRPLSDFEAGDVVEVVGYRGELRSYLRRALEEGLTLGTTVRILDKRPATVELEVGGRKRSLSSKAAKTVLVLPAPGPSAQDRDVPRLIGLGRPRDRRGRVCESSKGTAA